MAQQLLTKRYAGRIRGEELSCFDRVVISGMIPQIGYAEAMTAELFRRKIRIFDYTQFVEPLRDEIRKNAERLAREHGLQIEFVRLLNFRKEQRIKQILRERGEHPGLEPATRGLIDPILLDDRSRVIRRIRRTAWKVGKPSAWI